MEYLAEALRSDGVVRSLFPAMTAAQGASLELGWYGYVDGSEDETLCDETGETYDGSTVDEPLLCVIARVDLSD